MSGGGGALVVDILTEGGVLVLVADVLVGGDVLAVTVDALVGGGALAVVVVDAIVVYLQTLELDELVVEV